MAFEIISLFVASVYAGGVNLSAAELQNRTFINGSVARWDHATFFQTRL